MNNSMEFTKRIWNEERDLILLKKIVAKQKDIRNGVKTRVYEEIIEESFPTISVDQCRHRLSKLLTAFNQLKSGESEGQLRCRLTKKVVAKMEEIWPDGKRTWATGRRRGKNWTPSVLPRPKSPIQVPQRGKRAWQETTDLLLLDAQIDQQENRGLQSKDECFEDIVHECLPEFTVDQCKNRLKYLKKKYKRGPAHWNISESVYKKLDILHNGKINDESGFNSVGKFSEEDDLTLLDSLETVHPNLEEQIPFSMWQELLEEAMFSKFTPNKCRRRFRKLCECYKLCKASGKSSMPSLTSAVYEKLDEMFGGTQSDALQNHEICRCCGQMTNELTDLNSDTDILEWFLAFTGLPRAELEEPFTKICQICGDKLHEAQKFREQCLMGAQIIKTVVPDEPPPTEAEPESPAERKKPVKGPQTCQICGATFDNRAKLSRHLTFHNDGEIHECTKCTKQFTTKNDFTKHMKTHLPAKPGYLCNICGKICNSPQDLHYHNNTHTGVKPFKCPHCGQLFSRVHGLNNHVRSLHDNISYPCSDCGNQYKHIGKLKLHMLLVHKGAVLRCDHCDLQSTAYKSFKFHMRDYHKTKFDQSVHVILGNGERLLKRRRRLDNALIQTEKMEAETDEDLVKQALLNIEILEEEITEG